MKSLVLASVLLVPACFGGERATTGACPAGETCSDLTPRGLQFLGASLSDDANLSGPSPTAIGGTQAIQLQYDPTLDFFQPLDLSYTADDDGGNGVKVDHTAGAVVSVRGMGSRTNYLRISDASTGELFDRKELSGAAIDRFSLVPNTTELVPAGLDVAFASGNVKIGVALYGAVQESTGPQEERLVDQSMQIALAGSTQRAWDALEMPGASAGTYGLSVTAGDRPTANVEVIVVDHLDSLVADDSNDTTLAPNQSSVVCFDGLAGGRYVAGLTWHYTINNVDQASGLGNCVSVSALTTGPITIVGSADGLSATATIAVGAARTLPHAPRATRVTPTTAGDRAAL
ncbi:MAG: hypothetical protein ABI591_01855 [Kofleriaceae bacterium]